MPAKDSSVVPNLEKTCLLGLLVTRKVLFTGPNAWSSPHHEVVPILITVRLISTHSLGFDFGSYDFHGFGIEGDGTACVDELSGFRGESREGTVVVRMKEDVR